MAKILLIDDVAAVRRSIISILKQDDHEVIEVDTADTAVSTLKEASYDLVITDIILPGGGEVVIQEAMKCKMRPKILAISGGGWQLNGADALKHAVQWVDATLEKPFSREELLQAVNRLLQQ